jgi:competence protein ComEC
MRKLLALLVGISLVAVVTVRAQATLDVYFIDTEGGQATLLVLPSGQSMLVDTGFANNAERIFGVIKQAGVTMLDYVVITHYHGDHVGGAPELAARLPIRNFVDHGGYTVELQPNRVTGYAAYQPVRARGRIIVPKAGDSIALDTLDVQIVSASGGLIKAKMAGAPAAGQPNPLCRDAKLKTPDPTPENQESLGLVIRYGAFRMLDLGDLTWNLEHQLVCPNNLIGTFDVFHTTRHGDPNSGPPQLVHAIRSRVAVMNNGEKKGGAPEYWRVVRDAPGLEDLWQLHRSEAGGADHNSAEPYLANINETDHGYSLKMSVRMDGSFTMTNGRTGFSKSYGRPQVSSR